MTVKICVAALAVLTTTTAVAAAATIEVSPTRTATIQGHNAYSRFLSDAFVAIPPGWTDGSQAQNDPAGQAPASPETLNGPLPQELPPSQKAGSGDLSGRGSGLGSGLANVGSEQPGDSGFSPVGDGPSKGVSPVPLPAAFPLFGAALLALGAIGHRRRRAAAARRTTR